MQTSKFLRAAAFTLSSAGLLVPQSVFAAAPAVQSEVQPAAPAVLDVALSQGGVMRGQIVDGQGQPVANAPVALHHGGKEVASTSSDQEGNFAFSGLRGGQHVVVSGEYGGLCRVWTPETAPPSASSSMLLVHGNQTVRGQWFGGRPGGLLMLGVLGGIVAGGLISQGDDNRSGS
jgi:hypothetical protein